MLLKFPNITNQHHNVARYFSHRYFWLTNLSSLWLLTMTFFNLIYLKLRKKIFLFIYQVLRRNKAADLNDYMYGV